jgi:type III secretion system chaperone SycN
VYLIRSLPYLNEKVYREALRLCHPAERLPFPANPGLRGEDRLAFFIRLHSSEQTLPQLETAIDQLRQMHSRLDHVAA